MLFFFPSSPYNAPPIMSTAPVILTRDMVSLGNITESSTADSGSIYPHTTTDCAGSLLIDEKYKKQPSPGRSGK